MSKTTATARMRRDGGLVRIEPDGAEEVQDTPPLASRNAAKIEAPPRP
jgi:hypothetical protein